VARPLTPRPARQARALLVTTVLVVVLHALAWVALSLLLRPPSILKDVAPPFYTRTIAPEAPPAAVAVTPTAPAAKPNRPSARITTAKAAPKNKAKTSAAEPPQVAQAPTPAASAEEPAASEAPAWAETPHATEPPVPPAQVASASAPAQPSASAPASTPEARPGTAVAAASASGTDTAFLRQWPGDTRLKYQLGGNYRGELRGDARVLWQREGTRYHTSVQLDMGLLLSMSLTSQGEITPTGLQPGAYEEQVGKRRRSVRLGEDVRLDNGERVSRPNAVQDAASQFVELSHRFATGQLKAVPGTQINFWLARPGGVDEWTYDVVGEETLQLPSLGAVQAVHLKPRPLAKPRGPISAEIWYAPTLQFLPVRIRLTQGPDTYIDLLVDSIEQR
jgi:hypothetical protein